MYRLGMIAVGLLLLALMPSASAQSKADELSRAKTFIEALVQQDDFSGAVLVAKDGRVVLRAAYGLANRELGVVNTPETKFRIGSITKTFTAAAILQLQEAGKLSVDDKISKYYAAAPPSWQAITIKHLLTHRSGVGEVTSLPTFTKEVRLDQTTEHIIELTRDMPLAFEPGTKWAYSNSGYVLLGYVIEKVSGGSYADYVQKHIFQPLGMRSSGYDSNSAVILGRAAGYDRGPTNSGPVANAPYISMTMPHAAGALYSSIDDLLIWDRALSEKKLLDESSTQAMFTDYGNYSGFGWGINKEFGHLMTAKDGGIYGFNAFLARFPDDKLTVIVLSNRADADTSRIALELGGIYLGVAPRAADKRGEAALKALISGLTRGELDETVMEPRLAAAIKPQTANLQKRVGALGPLRSLTALHADANGFDFYKASFEKGAIDWRIRLADNGKLSNAFSRFRQ